MTRKYRGTSVECASICCLGVWACDLGQVARLEA